MEELLFCKCLETDIKGQKIFQALSDYLQNNSIPYTNITACATDGAPTIVGRYRGFSSLVKEKKTICLLCTACFSPSAFGRKAS